MEFKKEDLMKALTKQKAQLDSERDAHSKTKQIYQEKVNSLSEELRLAHENAARCAELALRLEELDEERSSLRSKLEQEEGDRRETETALNEEKRRFEIEKQQYEQELLQNKSELLFLRAEVQRLDSVGGEQAQKTNLLEAQLTSSFEDANVAKEYLKAAEAEVLRLQSMVDAQLKTREDADIRLDELQTQVSDLVKQRDDLNHQLESSIRLQVDGSTTRNLESVDGPLESQSVEFRSDASHEIDMLRANLVERDARITALVEQLESKTRSAPEQFPLLDASDINKKEPLWVEQQQEDLLIQKIHNLEAELKITIDQREQMFNSCEELRASEQHERDRVTDLEHALTQATSEIENLRLEIQQELLNHRSEQERNSKLQISLNAAIDELRSREQSRASESEGVPPKDQNDLSTALTSRVSHLEQELSQVIESRESYAKQVKDIEAELSQTITSKDILEQQLKVVESELAFTVAARDAYAQQLKHMETESAQATAERESIAHSLKELEIELSRTISAKESLAEQLKEVEVELTKTVVSHQQHAKQLQDLQVELSTAVAENQFYQQRLKEREIDLSESIRECESLRQRSQASSKLNKHPDEIEKNAPNSSGDVENGSHRTTADELVPETVKEETAFHSEAKDSEKSLRSSEANALTPSVNSSSHFHTAISNVEAADYVEANVSALQNQIQDLAARVAEITKAKNMAETKVEDAARINRRMEDEVRALRTELISSSTRFDALLGGEPGPWVQHANDDDAPVPTHLSLESPVIQTILQAWTQDRKNLSFFNKWCAHILSGGDIGPSAQFQKGVELSKCSPNVKDALLSMLVPMLRARPGIEISVFTRERLQVYHDVRLRVTKCEDRQSLQ